MIAGMMLLALGAGLPFAWGACSARFAASAHGAGLALMALGCACLIRTIARELRAARAGKTKPGEAARASLFLLACGAPLLLVEAGSSAAIPVFGLRERIQEFRRRQLFEGEPQKIAHPFLIMANNPKSKISNSLGFLDREWTGEKPEGRVRIACTGASTTEDGFPALLETALRANRPGRDIEVMNFGNSGWTSAQSLINYCLNIQRFKPDIVVIHDAANEVKVRGYGDFRSDYSHALGILAPPRKRSDAAFVRRSDGYALAKMLWMDARGAEAGLSVYDVIIKPNKKPAGLSLAELEPYRANVENLATLAAAQGSKIVIMTMPYSKTNASWGGHFALHMSEANGILRTIAAEHGYTLCDLDALITGHEESFRDPVHLQDDAIRLKVKALAATLGPLLPSASAGGGVE